MTSSSSFASNLQYCPRWKYDVFLSFRGEDTRKTILGYLYERLTRRGIITFQDDRRLELGDSIPEELLKAIEESQVALVVFSKNYATSKWCLNELVKIMECTKEGKEKIVIPVFYGVEPSHVKHQSENFAEAFAKHELKYMNDPEGMQKVKGWRTALTAAGNLNGHVFTNGVESDCIERIVDKISNKCKTSISYLHEVVGIDTQLKKVEGLLKMEIDDVRIVWIWGMGGVGKTTIAKTIFYKLSSKFKDICFLENIKENKHRMHSLQNILLSKLFGEKENCVRDKEEGRSLLARRLPSKRVLLVLDDIDHRDQLDYLAKDLGWFGKGSRIIATTRDKRLIGGNDIVYKVETLLDYDAIKLFNQYAFMEEVPNECFKDLTSEIVSYANGHPLALKVWGSSLHRMDITEWGSALVRIKHNSDLEITKNLKISYDGLEPEEQEIFLDIACFFRGNEKKEVMQILESCYSGSEIGLRVLVNKSLVFISENNMIEMHDLIQDMGKHIVQMQKHPGEHSRLWNVEDFKEMMDYNMGTISVKAIWFTYFDQLCFNKEAMNNMKMLRILRISVEDQYERLDAFSSESDSDDGLIEDLSNEYERMTSFPSNSNCYDGSIEYLSNNLRWLVWHDYPWKLLPKTFHAQRLVHLDLRWSSLHHLWNDTKQLPSLRKLDLSGSQSLKKIPDFRGMPNLEYLDLEKCTSLEEIHHSLVCSRKLIELNLLYCYNLKRLPYVNAESLKYLSLSCCLSLENFPEIIGILKPEIEIIMSYSGIRELPLSIIQLQAHLTELDLSGMDNLVSLPSSVCKLKDLVMLDVSECSKLESLPVEIGDLEKLERLDARDTLISRPPSSIVRMNKLKFLSFAKCESEVGVYFVFPQVNKGLFSLEQLHLSYCNLIDGGLPEDIGSLSSLKELDLRGNSFEHLPRSIAQLTALRTLYLSWCDRLQELPGFTGMPNLDILNLNYCNILDGGLPEDIGSLSSLKELDLIGNNFEYLPRSIAQLGALRSLDISGCKKLIQLPEFPQQLHTIYADWSNDSICHSLFQNISSLQHDISGSDSLSLRVLTSRKNIPSWFHHRGTGTRVIINLPENWYVSDNFLGFAVCYSGKLFDITANLIPLCDDGMSLMTQNLALSNHSLRFPSVAIHFFLVPLAALWDTAKANGKTPNDYGLIMLSFLRETKNYGFRLLYKDEAKLKALLQIRRSSDELRENSVNNEASCSSYKKQRSHF